MRLIRAYCEASAFRKNDAIKTGEIIEDYPSDKYKPDLFDFRDDR